MIIQLTNDQAQALHNLLTIMNVELLEADGVQLNSFNQAPNHSFGQY